MPQQRGHPPRQVTIEDCASCIYNDDRTAQCPHGMLWRPAAWRTLPPELQAKVCQEPACEAIEYLVHAGESITVRPPRTLGESEALVAGRREALAAVAPDDEDGRREAAITAGLAMFPGNVIAWSWTGPDGAPLPVPSVENLSALRNALSVAEILWVAEAILAGGDPRVAAEQEGNGSAASPST